MIGDGADALARQLALATLATLGESLRDGCFASNLGSDRPNNKNNNGKN